MDIQPTAVELGKEAYNTMRALTKDSVIAGATLATTGIGVVYGAMDKLRGGDSYKTFR